MTVKVEHEIKLDRTEMSTQSGRCMRLSLEKGSKRQTAELRKLLRLTPVSLLIKNDRLRWFGRGECRDVADCMLMGVD